MRFDRCILLAENSPDALDWPSLSRGWPWAMSATGEALREELMPLCMPTLPAAGADTVVAAAAAAAARHGLLLLHVVCCCCYK